MTASLLPAQSGKPIVYVAPIEGMIDLGLAPFVRRVLDEADKAGAAAVVLKINTFGGRVDAAVLIRDALVGAKVKTVAFIDKRAISAGALISLPPRVVVRPPSIEEAAPPPPVVVRRPATRGRVRVHGSPRLELRRDELRRAIVLMTVLGPPRALEHEAKEGGGGR